MVTVLWLWPSRSVAMPFYFTCLLKQVEGIVPNCTDFLLEKRYVKCPKWSFHCQNYTESDGHHVVKFYGNRQHSSHLSLLLGCIAHMLCIDAALCYASLVLGAHVTHIQWPHWLICHLGADCSRPKELCIKWSPDPPPHRKGYLCRYLCWQS